MPGAMPPVKRLFLLFVLATVSTSLFIIVVTDSASSFSYRRHPTHVNVSAAFTDKNFNPNNITKGLLTLRNVNELSTTNKAVNFTLTRSKFKNLVANDVAKKILSLQPPLTRLKFLRSRERFSVPQTHQTFNGLKWKLDSTEGGVCDPNTTFIVAVVPSALDSFERRQMLRNTWANKDYLEYTRIKAVFMLGDTLNATLQSQIESEATIYKDIVQVNYIDSYRNLTYKTMATFMWISQNCKDIPWILKIDDDVILNPYNLRSYLEDELEKNPSPSSIIGRLRPHSQPFRSGRWKVSKEEYSNKFYPPFILGSAYIIGRNCIEKLIAFANTVPFLYLEDVYFTGLVAQKAKIHLVNIERTHYVKKYPKELYKSKSIFLVGKSIKAQFTLWKLIYQYRPMLI